MALQNYAVVENGIVTNVIVFDPEPKQNWVRSDTARIGDTYDGKDFHSPVPPAPAIPQEVTALQGMLAIAQFGLGDAFEKWCSDDARTFVEKAFIRKAQVWRYDDETLNAGCATLGIAQEQKDQLFILAATL